MELSVFGIVNFLFVRLVVDGSTVGPCTSDLGGTYRTSDLSPIR